MKNTINKPKLLIMIGLFVGLVLLIALRLRPEQTSANSRMSPGLQPTPDLSTLETIDYLPETKDGIQRILDTQAELRLPEWIRIVIHTKNHPLYVVSNMSNEPLPLVQIQEYVYHFNDEGLIDKSYSTLTDEQGNLLQSSILKDGLAINLETGLEFASEPYPLDINVGIPLRTSGISSPSSTYANQTITFTEEGQQTIATLIGEEVFTDPVPFGSPEDLLINSIRWGSKYDANSGLPLSTVNFATLEDGTEIVVSEMSYLFDLEFIPSSQLLDLLE